MAVQVHGRAGDRRARQNAPHNTLLAYLTKGLGALGVSVFDSCGFIDGHKHVKIFDKILCYVHAFFAAESFYVHQQKLQRLMIPSERVSAPNLGSNNEGVEERVCLLLSDLHIGRRTPTFDSEVYTDRMSQLYEAVESIVRLHRNDSALRIIHVFDAGDNVHGERVGQQGRMNDFEFGIPEQLAISTNVMGELIDKLLGIFDEVHWHDAPGNHGNLDKIYSAGSNWDLVRVNLMENLKSNQERIFFHRPPHINRVAFSIADVMNHRFLVTHGDTIKSYGGFPFGSVIKKMVRI